MNLPVRGAASAAGPVAPARRRDAQALDAAARVLARKGYARASTGDIAEAMGIRQASLYYYFASKEDALLKVCEAGAQGHLERLREIAGSGLPPTEQIRRTIDSLLVPMRDRHDYVKVFLTERHLLPEASRNRLKPLTGEYGRVLRGMLEAGVAAGVLRADLDCDLAMRAILGLSNSAIFWFEPGGPVPVEAVVRSFSDLVLTGLLPPGGAAPAASVRRPSASQRTRKRGDPR